MSKSEGQPSETMTGNVGDVAAGEVTIRQGETRSVSARTVAIRQGGALRVQAQEVEVTQGGVAFATTSELEVTAGGVMAAIAHKATLEQSMAHVGAARDSVEMDQAASGLVVAKHVRARDSAIGLLVAREFTGEGVRVLLGTPAAFAFGAGFGLAVGLLTLLAQRR